MAQVDNLVMVAHNLDIDVDFKTEAELRHSSMQLRVGQRGSLVAGQLVQL